MPILPRPAVASSDFRPYSSSLNVVLEPTNPKASRPPIKASTGNSVNEVDLPHPRGSVGGGGGLGLGPAGSKNSNNSTRGGSMKQAAQSLLTAKA